ncbi:MAG: DUF2948 family protein [Hyphomicrobium sp.]
MSDLKLIALDADDLHVLSAHLQDAVLRVGDMAYLPREKRFVALANRFDWSNKLGGAAAGGKPASAVRRRTAVRCERVLSAKVTGLDLGDRRAALALLAMTFDRPNADAPDGDVTLTFSGGAAIRLSVECLEVQMQDLGAAWTAKSSPEHPDDPT